MNQSFIRQLLLYRFRYIIGSLAIAILLIGLLTLQLHSVPNGFSDDELQSAIQSASTPIDWRLNPVDLPYHLLQKASLFIFGLSVIGIKLPSLIIGFLSGIGMFMLLSRWFKKNVAIIVSILAITVSQFLIASRSGSPDVMLIFWPIFTLLFATLVSQEDRLSSLYKLLLGMTVVLSLYTPFTIYLLTSAFLATIIHPHLRYVVKRFGFAHFSITTLICGLLLVPLAYNLYLQPALILQLIGLPSDLPSISQYAHNILTVAASLGGFELRKVSTALIPAFSIGICVLMVFGLLRTFQHFYSARSHLLLVWIALLLPVVTTNPARLVIVYVPAMLLTAIGVEALIREWYKIFPTNPYARVAALVPLGILLLSLVSFNYVRYFNSFAYAPTTAHTYSSDTLLVSRDISRDIRPSVVVADSQQVETMKLLDYNYSGIPVITPAQLTPETLQGKRVYITASAKDVLSPEQITALGIPARLLVNDNALNSLRFQVFNR
jgi:hypothetical protein